MINLELATSKSQVIIDINKINNILIVDYKGYLNFYKYFYYLLIKKNNNYSIRISNKSLNSKNTIFLDFTSILNIFMLLDYKKGTLLYEYMISKYSYIDDIGYNKIFELYKEIQNKLSQNDDDIFYNIVSDLNKILYQGIELSYNEHNLIKTLEKILYEYIEKNNDRTIIMFINSDIVPLSTFSFNNVFVFDITRKKDYIDYNLITKDNIKELDFNIIKDTIIRNYPLIIDSKKIDNYIQIYYKNLIYLDNIYVQSEEELIIYSMLSKNNYLKQCIIPIDIQINNKIKSFLALL